VPPLCENIHFDVGDSARAVPEREDETGDRARVVSVALFDGRRAE